MTPPRPFAILAALVLGGGLAFRLLVPPAPVVPAALHVLPSLLLLAGGAIALLDGVLARDSRLAALPLLLPLLVVPGAFPPWTTGVLRATDFAAAIVAGLGLRDLVRRHGLAGPLVRGLLAIALLAAAIALAQVAYQRDEARAFAAASGHEITDTEKGRAFLASDRPSATFLNPNAFAGFLLLVMPFAVALAGSAGRRRERVILGTVLLLPTAAFFLAGSAGAAVSLLLGTGVLALLRPPLSPRIRRVAIVVSGLGALALAVAFIAAASGMSLPLLAGKVATFGERLGYHRLGARLLPEMGLFGLGLEATREVGPGVVRPGEPWSAYLHDSWFQLLLELGPLALLALVPFGLAVRVLVGFGTPPHGDHEAGRPKDAPQSTPIVARSFFAGLVVAAGLAPLVVRTVSIFPFAFDRAGLDAITNAALVGGALALLGRFALPASALQAAASVALAAFVVHGFLDFDLYVAGVATTFAAILAAVPTPPPRTAPRALVLAIALAALAVPPFLVDFASRADERTTLATSPDRDAAVRLSLDPGVDPAHLAKALRGLDPGAALAHLDALPPPIREWPSVRRIAVEDLSRRALGDAAFARVALPRITALLRAGERQEAALAYRLHLVHLALGDRAAAAEAAERSLAALRAWRLDDQEAPYRGELEGYLSGR